MGGDGRVPVGLTWGKSNLWNQGITKKNHPGTLFAINVECGPLYGVLVQPRVPSPSLEWNAKQDGGISWCHWGQIPTHQLSLFLYHHYTSQDVYTSRYSSWIGSKSIAIFTGWSFHLFQSRNSSRTDMKSPQQIRRSIAMPCFASFLPHGSAGKWKY